MPESNFICGVSTAGSQRTVAQGKESLGRKVKSAGVPLEEGVFRDASKGSGAEKTL